MLRFVFLLSLVCSPATAQEDPSGAKEDPVTQDDKADVAAELGKLMHLLEIVYEQEEAEADAEEVSFSPEDTGILPDICGDDSNQECGIEPTSIEMKHPAMVQTQEVLALPQPTI